MLQKIADKLKAWKLALLTIIGVAMTTRKANAPSGNVKDYRSLTGAPVGVRSNNPGNLIGGGAWQGMVGTNASGINIFSTWHYGIRAMIKTLHSYYYNHGLQTLRDIFHRYAPYGHGGNNPDQYAENVAAWIGIGPDQPLTWHRDPIKELAKAIHRQENSSNYAHLLTDQDFLTGWNMANV
jgi:hypothetical protein